MPLVGRDADLLRLEDSLRRCVSTQRPGLVLVRGEPGIGKTALLREFLGSAPAAAGDDALLAGYGQAITHSLGSDAFQAIRECLRSLVASAELDRGPIGLQRVGQAFKEHAPDWLESVPVIGSLLAAGVRTRATAMASRPRLPGAPLNSHLDQLVGLITELCQTGPVVILLDGLHWADTATVDILIALAVRVQGPLLLVGAYRPDDLRAGPSGEPHPLVRAQFRLRRYRPDLIEIDLARLSPADTITLIRDLDPDRLMGLGLIRRVAEQSAGIPLYAESLTLVETSRDKRRSAPADITAVLEERLSFASPDDQRLLETAVLVGFTFEAEFLASLARLDLDDLLDRLDVLMREHHLIVTAEPLGDLDRYSLYHPLQADILRTRAMDNGPRWRRANRRLVDLLLAGPDVSDESAVRAAAAAVAAGDPRAAALALDAARRQYAAGAVSKARQLAESVLATATGMNFVTLSDVLARCLAAEAAHGTAAEVCAHALEELAKLPQDAGALAMQVTLRLVRARNLRMLQAWDSCRRVLDELDAILPPGELMSRARALMIRAEIDLCGSEQDTASCIQACEQVIDALDQADSDDAELRSRALGHRGLAHLAAYQPAEAETWLRAAITVAEAYQHPYAQYEAWFWYSKKKLACLELDEIWAVLDRLSGMTDATGVARGIPFHLRDFSRASGLNGDLRQAATAFAQFFDLTRPEAEGRAITALLCQVRELEDLRGRPAADQLVEAVTAAVPSLMVDARRHRLEEIAQATAERPPEWDVLAFAEQTLGVSPAAGRDADATFRFYIPDLPRFRRQISVPG